MVTEEKTINNAMTRYRLGTMMIWLGVLIWLPFILLRAIGERPIFLWFLPFHLAGVIGGSRIRSLARKEMGLAPSKKNLLRIAGHGMIFLGILVWVPYLYFKLVIEVEKKIYIPLIIYESNRNKKGWLTCHPSSIGATASINPLMPLLRPSLLLQSQSLKV